MVKGGIAERFARFRAMGIRTVMITGDNPLHRPPPSPGRPGGRPTSSPEATPEAKNAASSRTSRRRASWSP